MPLLVTVGCPTDRIRYARDLLRRSGAVRTKTLAYNEPGLSLVEGLVLGINDPNGAKADLMTDNLNNDMQHVVTFKGLWLDDVQGAPRRRKK